MSNIVEILVRGQPGHTPTNDELRALIASLMATAVEVVAVAASRTLTDADDAKIFHNTGNPAQTSYVVDDGAVAATIAFTIINKTSSGSRLVAATGQIIRFGESASSAGGALSTTDVGATLHVAQIGSELVVISSTGSWI